MFRPIRGIDRYKVSARGGQRRGSCQHIPLGYYHPGLLGQLVGPRFSRATPAAHATPADTGQALIAKVGKRDPLSGLREHVREAAADQERPFSRGKYLRERARTTREVTQVPGDRKAQTQGPGDLRRRDRGALINFLP
jgi:hypothetical protein